MAEKPASNPIAELKKYEDAVAACNRCGFCTSYCPTYNATGLETQSPRGRNQTVRALIEGKVTDVAGAREIIDSCVLCGECTSVCFSEVPTAHLMIQARHALNQKVMSGSAVPTFVTKYLVNPSKLRSMLRWGYLGRKLGVAAVLRATGLLAKISPELAVADEVMGDVPPRTLLELPEAKGHHEARYREYDAAAHKIDALKKQGKPIPAAMSALAAKAGRYPKVALMAVCGSDFVRPAVGLATISILEKLKIDFVIPDGLCCGLSASSQGLLDHARAMAKKNIEAIERLKIETVLVDDSSCATQFKDYGTLFEGDAAWVERGRAFSEKVKELSVFLDEAGIRDFLARGAWRSGPVAYHDPCKAQYGQRLTNPPRVLLNAVPGLSLVPVPESDQCCGGGGTYNLSHPELSRQMLAAKVRNILSGSPKTVVTSSVSCLSQVAFGIRQAKPEVEVMHLAELLARVLSAVR